MRVMSIAALTCSLALLPSSALAQERVYLHCDIEEWGNLVFRLTISGNAITEWRQWARDRRAWVQLHADCGTDVTRPATGTCPVSATAYTVNWRMGHLLHSAIRIDRQTGAYHRRDESYIDGSGRRFTTPRVETFSGSCRRTENPELTPAPEPVL